MKERVDSRVLGAVRWVDAVTERAIPLPLAVSAPDLHFVRNLSGLSVIVSATGLDTYEHYFDLSTMPAEERVADLSREFSASVSDPTGCYLPRAFKIKLPRLTNPPRQPDGSRPASSIFDPIDISLLPASMTRVASGWAQVRVSARSTAAHPLKNLYLRLVATSGDKVLGRGMTDARGEGLVIVPGLKLFAPGETDDEVTTSETEARLEAIEAGSDDVIDWTELDEPSVTPADTLTLNLQAGKTYSVKYSEAGGLELNP
jgi:hypothetical protein